MNTVILYGSFMLMILWYDIPRLLANGIILAGCVSIICCFLLYRREFLRLLA